MTHRDPGIVQRIRLVQTGRARLGLGDGEWRLLLVRVTGKRSCSAMSLAELDAVVDELRRLGFGPGGREAPRKARRATPDLEAQQRMIRGLWAELGRAGAIPDASEAALERFVKRQAKVERLEWLHAGAAESVIGALRAIRARHDLAPGHGRASDW